MKRRIPAELEQLLQAALDAEQARLAQALVAEKRLRDEVTSLRSKRENLHRLGATGDLAYQVRLSDWTEWCDARLASLMRELAAYRAEREVLTTAVRRAFGRKQAVSAFIATESAKVLAERRRIEDSSFSARHTS